MAREFSFEEAIAPPAKAPAPREFSFEEAVGAKPAPKAKAKPTTADAEFDFDTPISGEFGGARVCITRSSAMQVDSDRFSDDEVRCIQNNNIAAKS